MICLTLPKRSAEISLLTLHVRRIHDLFNVHSLWIERRHRRPIGKRVQVYPGILRELPGEANKKGQVIDALRANCAQSVKPTIYVVRIDKARLSV